MSSKLLSCSSNTGFFKSIFLKSVLRHGLLCLLVSSLWAFSFFGCDDDGSSAQKDSATNTSADAEIDADFQDTGTPFLADYEIDLGTAPEELPISRALLGHYDLSGALFYYDTVDGLIGTMSAAGFSEWRVGVGRWEAASWLLPTLTNGSECSFPLDEAFAPEGWTDLDLIEARDWFTDNGAFVSIGDTDDDSRYDLDYLYEVLDVVEAFGAAPYVSVDHMPRALAANRDPLRTTENISDACQWTFANSVSNSGPADTQVFAAAVAGLVKRVVEGYAGHPARPIQYWEVWNEPEFCHFWDPIQDNSLGCLEDSAVDRMTAYFQMAIPILLALADYRSQSSHANTLGLRFGLGSFASAGTAVLTIEEFDKASIDIPVDFISFHAYDTDPRGILDTIRQVAEARQTSQRYSEVELVLAEWGPTLDATIDPRGMDQPLLMSTVILLGAAAGLNRAHHTFFWDYYPQNAIVWGLVDNNGQPRPLYYAYTLLSQLLSPDSVHLIPPENADSHLSPGATAPEDINTLFITRDSQGTHRALVINHTAKQKSFRLRIDGAEASPVEVKALFGEADTITSGVWEGSMVQLHPRSLTLITY